MREHLRELAVVLDECGDSTSAAKAAAAAIGTETELVAFLTSNDLWGGAGSIADQLGLANRRKADRKRLEAVLIQLGSKQMLRGVVNIRTAGWVSVFEAWAKNDI